MLRLATLAAKVKLPVSKVQSEILVKASGRLFYKWNDDFFAFKAGKDVILPIDLAQDYAKIKCNLYLPPPLSITDAEVNQYSAENDNRKRLVLTLLGHFNHGKTSLLDALINHSKKDPLSVSLLNNRDASSPLLVDGENLHKGKGQSIWKQDFDAISNLVSEEKYGITQEVRSRHIRVSPEFELTLIDTPGQEIFYRMRNTGSEVSDGSLLLVAVDDEIQLQTRESIGLIESSNKPAIVCINKIDLVSPSQDSEATKYSEIPKIKALIEECRDYIGLEDKPIIPISATKSINLDILTSELLKLFQDKYAPVPTRKGRGNRIPKVSRESLSNLQCNDPEETALASKTSDLTEIVADEYNSLTGRGVVLNLVHETGTPPSMHVLLREGTIRVGDFLQSGGWIGRVRSLMIEDAVSNSNEKTVVKKASTTRNDRLMEVAYPGMAVRIIPTYLEDCVDPRPVGERIHFFSPAVKEMVLQQKKHQYSKTATVMSNEKKRIEADAKNEALRARDEFIMEDEIDVFHMTEAQVARFRLMRLFASSRLPKQHFYVRTNRACPPWIGDDEHDSNTNNVEESEHDQDISSDNEDTVGVNNASSQVESVETVTEAKKLKLIIARMRSDLDMGTFLDRYHDYRDSCAAQKIPSKLRVIQSGIGTISKGDVQVAIAAGKDALLVGYGVDVESFALKDAKENNVKILLQDNMPDLLQEVFGSYGGEGNSTDTQSKKNKKRKKKKSSQQQLE